jgi:hypothetical protein
MEKGKRILEMLRLIAPALFLFFSLIACSGKMDPPAYRAWIQDYHNGLHVRKLIGDFVWDVQYTPTDYVWLQRTGFASGSNATTVRREIDQLQYFTVTIGLKEQHSDFLSYSANTPSEKQERRYYFSYRFQQDIYLEEGGERLPCVLYHFEPYATRSANCRSFVVGFENSGGSAQQACLIIDSPQFSATPLKITVSKDNLPALRL